MREHRRLPFAFTDGKWIRIPRKSRRKIWYRGLLVPMEAQDCVVQIPLSMFNGADAWKIYIGAGYRRVKRIPTLIEYHLMKT